MPRLGACPGLDRYQRLTSAELPEADTEELLAHLESCPACAQAVGTLQSQGEWLGLIQRARTLSDEAGETRVDDLVKRISRLRPGAEPEPAQGTDETQALPADFAKGSKYDFLAPPQAADELGRLGPYRVLQVLGAGGMGVVFRAEDPQLQRLVALKAMLRGSAASESAKQRFLREARSAAAIKHDHIVSIHQVGADRGVPFLAMEFLEGESLDERLQRDGKLPLAETLRIGREIADGLAAAHERGLIHRDIKPANVWLEGKRGRVKILDFGLARAGDDSSHLTQEGAIVGTPAYMAPEQARGEALDARCDLFSLGVVLYRMCTGLMPFTGTDTVSTLLSVAVEQPPPPAKLTAEVPPALSDLVMGLLEKDPARRPNSAAEVVQSLQGLQGGSAAAPAAAPGIACAEEVTASPRPGRALRTRRRRLTAACVALLALGPLAWLFGGTVYRFVTDQGELIVDVQDDNIDVLIRKDLHVIDKTSKREFTIAAGDGELEVFERDGVKLLTRKFELSRGGKTTVTITLKELADARKKAPGPALANALPAAQAKYALSFSEKKDRVFFPSLKLDWTRPLTLEAYATQLADAQQNSFLFTYGGIYLSGGKTWALTLYYEPNRGVYARSLFPVRLGKRTHVAGVCTGRRLHLFVDGERAVSEDYDAGAVRKPTNPSFSIGSEGSGSLCTGLIGEVRVSSSARYDKNFTPAQRFEPDADTLALYHFDEGQGEILKDSSGNGHHGKIVGARWVKADGTPAGPSSASMK